MNSFLIVLKKELKDIFRDRKTIIFTILLPIIMFPLMFKFMSYGMEQTQQSAVSNINVILKGNINSSLANLIKSQENITILEKEDSLQSLKDGETQLIVTIPDKFDENIENNLPTDIDILFDENSNNSSIASSIIQSLISGMKENIIHERLDSANIDSGILEPFNISVKSGVSADGNVNPLAGVLGNMLPSFIIIFMLTPVISIAADIGAGEKERGTFEPLLSTSCNRDSLLWGKIIAISIISAIALILSVVAMYYGMTNFYSGEEATGMVFSLNARSIAIILILCLLLLLAVCSVQIGVSIFARSTKEAGTYLSGVITPVMIVSYVPMFMDAKNLSFFIFNIPVANSVAIIKELMAGVFNLNHIGLVFTWHIVYVLIAIFVTKYMFSREEVIFRS